MYEILTNIIRFISTPFLLITNIFQKHHLIIKWVTLMPSIIFENKFDTWWSCIVCESVLAIKIIDIFYNFLSHLSVIFPMVFPLQFTSLISVEGIRNFTGADAKNPKFHHIKTVLCKNCFQHSFSDNSLSNQSPWQSFPQRFLFGWPLF